MQENACYADDPKRKISSLYEESQEEFILDKEQ